MNEDLLYTGSVKEVWRSKTPGLLEFRFTDQYSVFDWGKMPDLIPGKGEALATMGAYFFEKISQAESWKNFSAQPEALSLRKGAAKFPRKDDGEPSVPLLFNELGEALQKTGLRTHFRSRLKKEGKTTGFQVEGVAVSPPKEGYLLATPVADYTEARKTSAPKLVPLEFVFRFQAPKGSSLRARHEKGFPGGAPIGFTSIDGEWEFPILECFTKLERSDRLLGLSEALAISGLKLTELRRLLLLTAWVAGFLKATFREIGITLADGKIEWAVTEDGSPILVDSMGPDEMRLLHNGVDLSKEFLRFHYRKSAWFQAWEEAKKDSLKKKVEPPTPLPPEFLEAASLLYTSLAYAVTKEKVLSERSKPIASVAERISELLSEKRK